MGIEDILSYLFVFVLATFIGFEVIRRVSPLLHTPLMSLTNAISAISLVARCWCWGRSMTRCRWCSRAWRSPLRQSTW
jgi:NAD(P) transhydrogenase subunit alpha